MKIKGSSYFLMLIIFLAAGAIFLSAKIEQPSASRMPLVFASITFILGSVQLVREIIPAKLSVKVKTPEEQNEESTRGMGAYLVGGSWLIGLLVGVWLLGFLITIPLFVLAYTKRHGMRWSISILFVVVTTALIWGVFQQALGIELYPGMIDKLF